METDKKERLRQAAVALIAKRGFHETTTDAIAREAGVAVGTVYNYFNSKDDILAYIFEVEAEKREQFSHDVESREEIGPLDKIQRILEFHFEQLGSNPDLVRVIASERHHRKLQCRTGHLRLRGLRGILASILGAGIRSGQLRSHDPELIAQSLMGAVEAVVADLASEPRSDNGQARRAISELMAVLRSGVSSQATK